MFPVSGRNADGAFGGDLQGSLAKGTDGRGHGQEADKHEGYYQLGKLPEGAVTTNSGWWGTT